MLIISLPAQEFFDERVNRVIKEPAVKLHLEHSLVSLSKWEEVYEKPFLSKEQKTAEESRDYAYYMITEEVPKSIMDRFTKENYQAITDRIGAKMTATWFGGEKPKPTREIITAEVIYYWMVACEIPFECQYWHLNRLFTLIKVVNAKNEKPQKPTGADMAQRRALNEKRRAELNSKG